MTYSVHSDPIVQVGVGRGRQFLDAVMEGNEEGKAVHCSTPCILYIVYTVDLTLYTFQYTKKIKSVLKPHWESLRLTGSPFCYHKKFPISTFPTN